MSRIGRFEELIAWQKARALTREIYSATRQSEFARDFALVSQIRRAAISIMSNIAEGFECRGRGEFHQFLSVAKASCVEVRSQLYIAFDAGYLDENKFCSLIESAEEVGKIISGLRSTVERQRLQDQTKS